MDRHTRSRTGKKSISVLSTLFKRRILNNKDTFFTAQDAWTSRDYVPEPQDPFEPGSHEWCKSYVPWGEGLTFDMILWQRACDTDNDGKYGCGDTTFDASEDGGVCSSIEIYHGRTRRSSNS